MIKTSVLNVATVGFVCAFAQLVPSAGAAVVFSNFGPGDTFDAGTAHSIRGDIPILSAVAFSPSGTFTLDSIELPLGYVDVPGNETSDVKVLLYADDVGLPGTIIEVLGVIDVAVGLAIYSIESSSNPVLANGDMYYVGTSPASISTIASWPVNVVGQMGHYSRVTIDPWELIEHQTSGTFRVNGTIVPEPSSLTLLGLGGLAAFGFARRRRSRQWRR